MKTTIALLILLAVPSFAQTNTRWDSTSSTTTGTGQLLPMLAIPGANVAFYLCTAGVCNTPAVTYQSATSTTPCPSGAQVVWQPPVTQGCVGTSDSQGNFGAWFQPGLYTYTLSISGAQSGPYYFSVGAGNGTGSGNPPNYSVQYYLNGGLSSDSCITINPITHTLAACGSGTGTIQICGGTSGLCVTETVPGTATAYTWTIPGLAPVAGTGVNCITAYPGAGAYSSWSQCNGGPFNPTNRTTYINTPMPPGALLATDAGVLCNGSNDDYPKLQTLLNSLPRVVGVLQAPPQPMVQGVVQLPQGHCLLSQPLILRDYGSLQGLGNGTWISPGASWAAPAGSALVNVVETYTPNSTGGPPDGQIQTAAGRFVRDLNFEYNANASQITAIKIYNETGTATTPYPNGSTTNPQPYQIPNVHLDNIFVFAMDTAVDLEDCGNCVLNNINAFAVRQGVVNGGNNYSLQWTNGNILDGITSYTPIGGSTYGVSSASEGRYSCTGGTGASCTGGTIAQNVTVSPQTFKMEGVTVESFTYDGYIANCLNFLANNNGFDAGGTAGLYLGPIKFANVYDNFMATNTGDGIQLAAVTSSQGAGIGNSDGGWIYGNQIYSYQSSTGAGINFLSGGGTGANARRNVYVKDNQLSSWGIGVNVQSPLTYSNLTGNYGNSITTSLFAFPVTAAGSYSNTVFRDNMATSAFPCYTSTAGSGLVVGFNSCGNPTFGGQLTGTQFASGPGCSVTSSVGNNCLATITIPQQYLDTNYSVSCGSIIGASANVALGLVVKTNGAQFGVYENSLGTAASGGTITCTVNDQ